MLLSDLDYEFPAELTATEPSRPTRVAFSSPGAEPLELSLDDLIARFGPDDLFVINQSKVTPARVFSKEEIEILFLRPHPAASAVGSEWEVLFPAREHKLGAEFTLPEGIVATLAAKGLPQRLALSKPIDAAYFDRHGEMALPPYIQEARGERHNRASDAEWYQTAWAQTPGSVAAPTASLHFTAEHLRRLKNVARLTLHVGAGTFFPIRSERLAEHQMHSEFVSMPMELKERVAATRAKGGKVWALGTTVCRALESVEVLQKCGNELAGETTLFVYPPYEFKNVDVLLTNFHQPRSSLLALVAAFAGLERVKDTYAWAIARRYKLFSYGDLSAWTR